MARLLETKLKAQGYKVYLDVHTAERGVYTDRHKRQVQTSSDLILVLSPGSMDDCFDPRDAVVQEIRWALEAGVNIIPYVLEGFKRPLSAPPEVNKVLDIQGVEDSAAYADSAFESLLSMMQDSAYTNGVPPMSRHTSGQVQHGGSSVGLDKTVRPAPRPRRSGGLFRFIVIIALLALAAAVLNNVLSGQEQQVITLNAVSAEDGILLVWTEVDNPHATYTLNVQDASGAWRSRITTSGTSYTDTRVEPGNTYRYQIVARSDGKTIASAEQTFRLVATSVSATPTRSAATATPRLTSVSMRIYATPLSGAVQLNWSSANISDVRYQLERRTGDSNAWQTLTRTTATTFTDTSAWPSTVYEYRITASDSRYDYGSAICTGIALDTATPVPAYAEYMPWIPAGGIHANCGSRQSIMWVQQCLRKLLNTSLAVDGNWGSVTEEAVLQFKRTYGLPADDAFLQADEVRFMLDLYVQRNQPLDYLAPYAALDGAVSEDSGSANTGFSYERYLPVIPAGGVHANCGNRDSIMWVQQCLRRIGYGSLAVDGNWGSATDNAVLAFKRANGFSASSSVLTRDVLIAMLREYYEENQPLSYLEGYAAP